MKQLEMILRPSKHRARARRRRVRANWWFQQMREAVDAAGLKNQKSEIRGQRPDGEMSAALLLTSALCSLLSSSLC